MHIRYIRFYKYKGHKFKCKERRKKKSTEQKIEKHIYKKETAPRAKLKLFNAGCPR